MDPAIMIFGLGIGLLVGMTGMGGASLMTPLLILLFGVTPVTAIGTDIFYAAVTKTVGGVQHLRLKTVHRALALWLAVGSVPSAILGVYVIELLQQRYGEDIDKLVLGMLGGALVVVGVATLLRSVLLRHVIQERYAMHMYTRHIVAAVVLGMVTGFVIGITSAGSGTLIAIGLITIFRLVPQRVVGTDIVHAAILLWAAGIAHWIGGNVDFLLAGNILAGSIPGVLLGGMLAVRTPQRFLRTALAVVLIAAGTILILTDSTPEVVIPAMVVAALMVGALFSVQTITNARRAGVRRRGSPEPGGAAGG